MQPRYSCLKETLQKSAHAFPAISSAHSKADGLMQGHGGQGEYSQPTVLLIFYCLDKVFAYNLGGQHPSPLPCSLSGFLLQLLGHWVRIAWKPPWDPYSPPSSSSSEGVSDVARLMADHGVDSALAVAPTPDTLTPYPDTRYPHSSGSSLADTKAIFQAHTPSCLKLRLPLYARITSRRN
jgi:hypothetical protein